MAARDWELVRAESGPGGLAHEISRDDLGLQEKQARQFMSIIQCFALSDSVEQMISVQNPP